MEVDFLLRDFTPQMGRELDKILQLIVMGAKPHCYRVLAFIMRRQRGESSQVAWRILDGGELEPTESILRKPPSQNAATEAAVLEASQNHQSAPSVAVTSSVSQAQVYQPHQASSGMPPQPTFHFFSPVRQTSSSTRPSGPLYFPPRPWQPSRT